jgi:hypothetical protein
MVFEQRVYVRDSDRSKKLAMARYPYEELLVEGQPNPAFFRGFTDEPGSFEAARAAVEKAFLEHWSKQP